MDFQINLHSIEFKLKFDENSINNMITIFKDHPLYYEIEESLHNLLILEKKIKSVKNSYKNSITQVTNELREEVKKPQEIDTLSKIKLKVNERLKLINECKTSIKNENIIENWKVNHKKINDFFNEQIMIPKNNDLELNISYNNFLNFIKGKNLSAIELNSFVRFMIYFQYENLPNLHIQTNTMVSTKLIEQCKWLKADDLRVIANIDLVTAIKDACKAFISQKEEKSLFDKPPINAFNKFYPFFKIEFLNNKNIYNIVTLEDFYFDKLLNYQTEEIVSKVNELFQKLHENKAKSLKNSFMSKFNYFKDKYNVSTAELCLYNEISKIKSELYNEVSKTKSGLFNEISKIEAGIFKFENKKCDFNNCFILKYIVKKENIFLGSYVNNSKRILKSNFDYLSPLFQYVVISNIKYTTEKSMKNVVQLPKLKNDFNILINNYLEDFKKYVNNKKQEKNDKPITVKNNFINKFINNTKEFVGEGTKLRYSKAILIEKMIYKIESRKEITPLDLHLIVKETYNNINIKACQHKIIGFENPFGEKTTILDTLKSFLSEIKKYSKDGNCIAL